MSIESPKTAGLVTIRYIVMSILNRMNDYTMRNYKRLVQIAIEGFGELSLWHLNTLEVVYLTMNTAKVVDLPADYIDYLKVGVPINGKLRVLTQHNQILLPRTFYNSLEQSATQFVTDNAAAYLLGGVVVTASSNTIIFTSSVAGVDFTGATSITNLTGNLTGTVVNYQANAPAVKRIDIITLTGDNGTANIVCDAVTKLLTFDTGTEVGNADASDTVDAASLVFFSDHFRGGQYVGGLYGMPGGVDDAYFRIDRENRKIVFSGSVPRSEIVLEYISTGVKTEDGSLIPREAIPALRTYVLWQMIEHDTRIALNEKERRKRNHEEEVEALRSFQSIFTADQYKRMLWSSSRQTAKR
jgi:hypothetical protein